MELREHVTERDAKDVVDMMQEVPTFRSATAPHEQIVLLPPYITFFLGTIRERRHRASLQPNYSFVAVGRRGLGPREQEEQRTQRVFRGYVSYESTHRGRQLIVLGSDAFVEKNAT